MKPRNMLLGLGIGGGLGLLLGRLAGGAPWLQWLTDNIAAPVGQVFLRLLFMLVVPLVFSALVSGIAELELRQLGRIGLRTLLYTVTVTAVAVIIGIGLVNVLRPGAGAPESLRAAAGASPSNAVVPANSSVKDVLVAMVPDNPVKAAAAGDMAGVIIFALVFGVSMAASTGPATPRLREVMQGLYEVMMTAIGGVMRVAPIGVGALLFVMTVRLGAGPLRQLAAYVGVTVLGLSLHLVVVYSLLLRVIGRASPWRFFRDVRPAMITAFSTSSSSATLPTALKVAEENLKLPPAVSRFVLTVGATLNQNGSALFEGVTVLFLAQFYGVELSVSQQVLVMGVAILSGVGAAGVPGSTLPVIAMLLVMLGIPTEGMALILGVDRLLDMCRTTVNVVGDLVAAVCLSPRAQES
ncbi:MAG TPA: dicarboxylate/amino acid:cation symporter [Myxococcaceae bacterium]|jgi:DAACS family dicarboxylate/amino acid:cation (Na+ or H+) symporter